jgi:hypothetical protein
MIRIERWLMNKEIKFDQLLYAMIREKGKGATWESAGKHLSLLLLERGRQEGSWVDRVRGVGLALASPPSASWAENTIMTECTQESGHRQVYVLLVCGYDYVNPRRPEIKSLAQRESRISTERSSLYFLFSAVTCLCRLSP